MRDEDVAVRGLAVQAVGLLQADAHATAVPRRRRTLRSDENPDGPVFRTDVRDVLECYACCWV